MTQVSQKSSALLRSLLALGAVALLLFGFAGFILAPGHVPLLDANRTRLAESYLEGWASGFTYIRTGGSGSATIAAEQRESHAALDNTYDPTVVHSAFCGGAVAAGFGGNAQTDCVDVLVDLQWWPTYDGELTGAWNDAFPYPLGALGEAPAEDSGRTGDRPIVERED